MCNFATLLGLWIAYEASPATIQSKVGHVLTISGAITSTILYFLVAWLVLRPKQHEAKQADIDELHNDEQKERKLFVCTNGYPLQPSSTTCYRLSARDHGSPHTQNLPPTLPAVSKLFVINFRRLLGGYPSPQWAHFRRSFVTRGSENSLMAKNDKCVSHRE